MDTRSWIVKGQTPEPKQETYEVRVERIADQNGMYEWTDEQIEAMSKNFGHECQQTAHFIMRQRFNERTPLEERLKYDGLWTK